MPRTGDGRLRRHPFAVGVVSGIATLAILGALTPDGIRVTPERADRTTLPSTVGPSSPPSGQARSEEPPALVRVAKVRGILEARAVKVLEASGLVVLTAEKYSRAPAGTVLQQSLRGGTRAEAGSIIRLSIARPFPRVPGVIGRGLAGARSVLRIAGYEVKVVREVSTRPTGTVTAQSPTGGTELLPGNVVTITVAEAAPPPPPSNCTPGYSPCLPHASDYDCAGGSGNGPKYVYGTVRVTGSDPYGLDADGDGYGCE